MRLASISLLPLSLATLVLVGGPVSAHSQRVALAAVDTRDPIPSFPVPSLFGAPPRHSENASRSAVPPPTIYKHPAVEAAVSVEASTHDAEVTEGFEHSISTAQVERSAGTFGDPSRYLQTLAGVASDNDQRNDFLVRGGNPAENSFVIDGIEVPSINQLALSDTTGGFVSMLDAAAIQQIKLHTDSYDSRFDQRLSSIVEISTRPTGRIERHTTEEVGIAGAGGSMSRGFGQSGSLFVSTREGVLQYLTDDIGMNGVPKYRNAFVRAENRIDAKNSWWGLSLLGIDSIAIHPSATDDAETNPFDIHYSGWRSTSGINWQHLFSERSFGVASLAYSRQAQSIQENGQLLDNSIVYNEQTSDALTTAKYDYTLAAGKRLTLTAGARTSLDQLNYAVAQPMGLANPYSEDPAPVDAGAMSRRFGTLSSAGYVQAAISLPRGMELVLGERVSHWALGDHTVETAKALFSAPVFGKLFHAGYSEYAQLPSNLYLLSFDNVHTLKPIRSRQLTAGVTLADSSAVRLTLEAYQKQYLDYPVAANYPQLSLANIADTFGQAFLLFPMVAEGKGIARGVELTAETRLTSKIRITATGAYARNWYSGLDGILRKGNFDMPLSANVTGDWRLAHGFNLSWRYTTSSGKPYTPDNMPLSYAQDRDVYDLSQVNAVRARAYRRLDFRIEQAVAMRGGIMTWHIGLQNALDTKNFYSQQWQSNVAPGALAEQDQMPRFPDGGVKFSF